MRARSTIFFTTSILQNNLIIYDMKRKKYLITLIFAFCFAAMAFAACMPDEEDNGKQKQERIDNCVPKVSPNQ